MSNKIFSNLVLIFNEENVKIKYLAHSIINMPC